MRQGEGCGLCDDAHLPSNPFSDLLAETNWSFIRLCRNQTHPGYSVVVAKRHAPELHDLTVEERNGFWSDVAMIGRAISGLFQPVKLANLSMGFRMPHFHCHVYPQYQQDDPFRLIDITEGNVQLADDDWKVRISSIQEFLAGEKG
jgi:diadenosine tetraphosphate (Ap4A) HIT family hydrolase